jgi:RNA polymerase sigma factor (sigma-70 family)
VKTDSASRASDGRAGDAGEAVVTVVHQAMNRAEATVEDRVLVAICQREYAPLVGLLGLYCGSREEAEDLAQEALIRLASRWDSETIDNPRAWLRRVGFNLATSRARRSMAHRRALRRAEMERAVEREADAADAVAVRRALRSLPERERRVLVLRYYADLSVADTAAEMGCPEGTVKTLTHKAIAALRAAGFEVKAND